MVRLVFRPYTQIWRSICTSEPLRASTRVSSGFTLFRHSSPSFGSQHTCSTADPSQKVWSGRRCSPRQGSQLSLSLRARVFHPNTRRHVRLLGPCFKTGRLKPLCQHPKHERGTRPGLSACWVPQSQSLYTTKGYNTSEDATFPWTLSNGRNWCWPIIWKIRPAKARLIPTQCDWLQAFPFQQFHVLFNSLSKVLFIFPSRYLFAIGLSPIFSLRWNLPPTLSCIPKQLDS